MRKIACSKLSLIAVLTIIISMFASNSTYAASDFENSNLKINFGDFYLSTDYDENLVRTQLVTKSNNNQVINIFNNETGKIIETITCIEENVENTLMKSASARNYSYYTVKRNKSDQLATVTLDVKLWIYKEGSFSQIERVESTNLRITSSGNSTLEDVESSAAPISNSFPTTGVEYSGSGVITIATEITSSDQLSVGFSIPEVMEMGYSSSIGTGRSFYLRKPVQIGGTFYAY